MFLTKRKKIEINVYRYCVTIVANFLRFIKFKNAALLSRTVFCVQTVHRKTDGRDYVNTRKNSNGYDRINYGMKSGTPSTVYVMFYSLNTKIQKDKLNDGYSLCQSTHTS